MSSLVDFDSLRLVSEQELAEHASAKSSWLSLYGMVWDVTKVLEWHPGGREIILRFAGKPDATKEFEIHHARSILDATLNRGAIVGRVRSIVPVTKPLNQFT